MPLRRAWWAILLIVCLVALPLALRERPQPAPAGVRTLVIITPHGEPIRAEFTRAFAAWARAERGLAVDIDWRTPGGTSEITRYLDSRFAAAFASARPGPIKGFNQDRLPADAPPEQHAARAAFLASADGVGIDLIFGGGEFPFRSLAAKGYLVDAGLVAAEPTWFTPAVIPQTLSGETVYDPQGRYYGACLAVFGIAANPDRLRGRGLPVPTQWAELAEPAYRAGLTVADPTKSGAVVTAMERILQQAMATACAAGDTPQARAAGWAQGVERLRRLVANARAVTDSASKPTRDTVRGDCLASMAIDFQAKSEAEWSAQESGGEPRLVFRVPVGGTSVSADPIALLRGAPERALAVDFIRFVLSPAGQRLWNYRPGTPGGPQRWCLHRYPVRADVLDDDWRRHAAEPDEDPFAIARSFTYRPAWTAACYPLIGPLVKAIALDPHEEVVAAWGAICAAGGPERVPQAAAAFDYQPFAYAQAAEVRAALAKGPEQALPLVRGWTAAAIARYREARRLAEEGR